MTKRYVIIGAGAVGGGIGGLLAVHDVPVTLVARGEHLDRMRSDGLRLRMPDSDRMIPVDAIAGPDEIQLTPGDVLVLATKTHQAESALADWAGVRVGDSSAGESLPLLVALNGVAAESRALRWFRRVHGVSVWMPSARLAPGEIILRGADPAGVLHLGRVPARLTTAADRALLGRVAEDWTTAGFRVLLPDDVLPWKYSKLLSNLGSAVQALLGTGGDDITEALRDEARHIYAEAGVSVVPDAEVQEAWEGMRIEPVSGQPEGLGGSTWQSMVRRTGSTEADFLNGEIVAMANSLGLSAPLNAGVARLIREASRTGALPGELTVVDLRVALGL
ncbi:MAG: ketopantoate reductase family protein [Propionibacteriaceae bacterium]